MSPGLLCLILPLCKYHWISSRRLLSWRLLFSSSPCFSGVAVVAAGNDKVRAPVLEVKSVVGDDCILQCRAHYKPGVEYVAVRWYKVNMSCTCWSSTWVNKYYHVKNITMPVVATTTGAVLTPVLFGHSWWSSDDVTGHCESEWHDAGAPAVGGGKDPQHSPAQHDMWWQRPVHLPPGSTSGRAEPGRTGPPHPDRWEKWSSAYGTWPFY